VLQGAFHKLEAGFSWRLNPVREPLAQAAYFVGYVPIAVLGIVGVFLARRRREAILIGMLFLAFMAVTAVFWAHTSHRSYLDVYWIVFAASVMEGFRMRLVWRVQTLNGRLWHGSKNGWLGSCLQDMQYKLIFL
jgi:apolipoprotein N-acyltransferase